MGTDQDWSIQVNRVDPGDVVIEASFRAAIYENLLQELAKRKQFKHVFRSGDRSTNNASRLLILRTTVQAFTPGSETRRAVTTVTGATKLSVRVQVFTQDGRLVGEHSVSSGVRFIGSNLRATHNLAKSVAAALAKSSLPH